MVERASEALLTLTADIVAAHVSNNTVAVGDLPRLIGEVHAALNGLGKAEPAQPQQPAVSVRSSVKPEFIVCLEDGKKLLMLKRHLKVDHQMTPSEYRAKWQLPPEYPLVAPSYSEKRRALAHQIGLGRRDGAAAPAAEAKQVRAGKSRARKAGNDGQQSEPPV